jgi:hypothetical protein
MEILSIQCDINNKDEIGVLSQSFNTLIKENKRLLEDIIEYDRLKLNFFLMYHMNLKHH